MASMAGTRSWLDGVMIECRTPACGLQPTAYGRISAARESAPIGPAQAPLRGANVESGCTLPAMPAGTFVTGVNLPWMHYGGDFGANAWRPQGGVGQPDRHAELDDTLARLADRGLGVVRWFVLADGRAGVTVDDQQYVAVGSVLGSLILEGFDSKKHGKDHFSSLTERSKPSKIR